MDPSTYAFQASWILEARGRRETRRSFAWSIAWRKLVWLQPVGWLGIEGIFFLSRLGFSSFFSLPLSPKEGRDLGGSESGFLLEVKGWGAPILLLLLSSAAFQEDAFAGEATAHDGGAGERAGGRRGGRKSLPVSERIHF